MMKSSVWRKSLTAPSRLPRWDFDKRLWFLVSLAEKISLKIFVCSQSDVTITKAFRTLCEILPTAVMSTKIWMLLLQHKSTAFNCVFSLFTELGPFCWECVLDYTVCRIDRAASIASPSSEWHTLLTAVHRHSAWTKTQLTIFVLWILTSPYTWLSTVPTGFPVIERHEQDSFLLGPPSAHELPRAPAHLLLLFL